MKILITGANGLLGQKLVALLASKKEVTTIATGRGADRNPKGIHLYSTMDVTDEGNIAEVLAEHKPDVVINTAAMTNVDQCEQDQENCWKQNVIAVEILSKKCQELNAFLIHISTDFIFDGANGPYGEDDMPNPINFYGESKLASEKAIQKSTSNDWAIVRTGLVYGIVPRMSRSNIVLWVMKSLGEKKEIKVVNDQWRGPTLVEDLAIGCYLIAQKKAKGVFNISGEEILTPYDMAVKTARFFDLDTSTMQEADGSIFTQPAKRPPRTGLQLTKAQSELDYKPRSFDEGIELLSRQLS